MRKRKIGSAAQMVVDTKVRPPAQASWWVDRARLIRLLNKGKHFPITLISAPAGFGKTVLTAQWTYQLEIPTAWLTIDDADNSLEHFYSGLVEAVRSVLCLIRMSPEPYLGTVRTPPPMLLADNLIADFTDFGEPVTLVLDGVHLLEDANVLALVSRLLDRLPANLHVVLLCRGEPALALTRHRLQQRLHGFNALDLQFTREETAAFLTQVFSRRPTPQIITSLHQKTGGWIGALALARLSLPDDADPEGMVQRLSGASSTVTSFLMDEVVTVQPKPMQTLLSVSALFDRFSAELLDAAMYDMPAVPPVRTALDALLRHNLLLVPVDEENGWYRYHDLMRELLTDRIAGQLRVDEIRRIRSLGAEWLAERGYVDEAMKQYLAAGDETAATELLEQHMGRLIDCDISRKSLKDLTRMFPAHIRKSHPLFLVAELYEKCHQWDLKGLAALLETVPARLSDSECGLTERIRERIRVDVEGPRCFYLYWTGDLDGALSAGCRALERTSTDRRHEQYYAIMYLAGAHAMLGRLEEALRLLSLYTAEALAAGSHHAGGYLVGRMGLLYYAGNAEGVRQTAETIFELYAQGAVHHYWYCHAYYFLGCIEYESNHLDAAKRCFREVMRQRFQMNARPAHDGLIGLALVSLAKKQWKKAAKYAAFARSFARENHDSYSLMISESLRTRETLAERKVSAAATVYVPEAAVNFLWLENPVLTYAEFLLAAGDAQKHEEALSYIEKERERAARGHNLRQRVQLDTVWVVALHCAGHRQQGLTALQELINEAVPIGFVRTFVDRGPVMAEMVLQIAENDPGNTYVAALLNAFGDRDSGAPDVPTARRDDDRASAVSISLSRREREVMAHLKGVATIKEIAETLFVSPETVKKHTHRIYRKLNVKNRAQAVTTAMERGLVF